MSAVVSSDVQASSLSADRLAAELERVECASVLVVHPDLLTTAIRACANAGAVLMVRTSADRCAPGEWELF